MQPAPKPEPRKRQRTRLRARSAYQSHLQRVRVANLMDWTGGKEWPCEAHCSPRCNNVASDAHEILPRSKGGSITSRDNVKLVCRHCHDFIHQNPAKARALKLLK